MTLNILGTSYSFLIKKREDDKYLEEMDGYCDWTAKEIVVADIEPDSDSVKNVKAYMEKVARHEIIHAFLIESGLHEAATFDDTHFEQMVDWIAIQFPKIQRVINQIKEQFHV